MTDLLDDQLGGTYAARICKKEARVKVLAELISRSPAARPALIGGAGSVNGVSRHADLGDVARRFLTRENPCSDSPY
jgi:hypothetical protein